MIRSSVSRSRISTFILAAVTPMVLFTAAAHAQELVVKNDNLPAIDPDNPFVGQVGLINNFDAGEKVAAIFTIPTNYRPARIKRVQILWYSSSGTTGNSIEESIEVWRGSVLMPTVSPTPSRIFDSVNVDPDGFSPQMTDGYLNEFDLSQFNIIVPDTYARFTVALVFANNTSAPQGPTVPIDLNGVQAGRNAIYGVPPFGGGVQWWDLATAQSFGDYIIRAVIEKAPVQITRCNPADIADDQGNPLPGPGNVPNGGVNEGDYNCFFSAAGFFNQAASGPAGVGGFCDIADDQGTPKPPFGTPIGANNGVNEGDYNCFFNALFSACVP
ncbi:MAG: hypothetical protein IBJ18_07860 [Phycisphaerales bacterium]|nr:hypothetical protein [Phycisphaerales bacterium]